MHAAHPTPVPTILVCEDESSLRELIRISLGDGYHVVEAVSGDEALERAAARRPDLVILDLMLPGIGGLDVLAALRVDPRTAGVPVAVVSAWSGVEGEALAAGANRFVPKPFDPGALRSLVEELLAA